MASPSPLTGVVLIDCARANVKNGAAYACQQCGYGEDVAAFQDALKAACADIKIDIQEFSDLAKGDRTLSPTPTFRPHQ